MAAHAIGTADKAAAPTADAQAPLPAPAPTPTSVKLMRNVDLIAFPVALVLFLVAGLPLAGFLAGLGAWVAQRLLNEVATRRAKVAEDVRTRVGLLAGSMILRGWIVAGIIVAVGIGDSDAGLAAAVLFLAVFTLQLTMTMAMRPFEIAAAAARTPQEPGEAR